MTGLYYSSSLNRRIDLHIVACATGVSIVTVDTHALTSDATTVGAS